MGEIQEYGNLRRANPLQLLKYFSEQTGCLRIFSSSVSWSIYLEHGKIAYATHSVAPLDRLSCHLRRLSYRTEVQVGAIEQLRRILEFIESKKHSIQPPEYRAIDSLVIQNYLCDSQASELVERLTKEAVGSLLLITGGTYEFKPGLDTLPLPKFCELDLSPTLEHCQKQLQGWQSLGPEIWSPYQRPLFLSQIRAQPQRATDTPHELNAMLKGRISFYHLAAILNRNELELAQSLHELVNSKIVALYDPEPPFNQLPRIINRDLLVDTPIDFTTVSTTKTATYSAQQRQVARTKTYTVACVDDSQAMLNAINMYLADESLKPELINDPIKALMQIIRLKPDLILLDIEMPNIDGYELCRLVRHHSRFKDTPIIMVTGSKGIIDRVKARLVGASGYLTKPFNRADLLKTVFRHLH